MLALPGFDEFLLGYADRSLVLPPEHADKIVPGGNGVFKKTIVAGGGVVGTWARGRRAGGAEPRVVPEPFDPVNGLRPAAQKSFELQAAKYRRFLGRPEQGRAPRGFRWRCGACGAAAPRRPTAAGRPP